MTNIQQNKQTLWVIFQKFWQKTNLKTLILSVYNEVKTKSVYNQVYSYGFNEQSHQHLRLTLTGVWGIATISVNPNTRSTGEAIISINPARHTSKTSASGRGGYNRYIPSRKNTIVTTAVRAKRTREEVSSGHLSLRKLRHT